MQIKTKAIVLSSLKYGDTSLIVRAFTASDGLKSYLLKGVLTSKRGKLKSALFQPLTQLELTANHKNKGTLESIREAKVVQVYKSIHIDIIKNSIVLFLAEMLANSIQEEEKNKKLYNYLEYAITWLDTHPTKVNFHLLFLIQLTRYLGFYPDISEEHLPYFDLVDGVFCTIPTLHPTLQGEELRLFKQFLGINFDTLYKVKTTKTNRQELLKKIILFFEIWYFCYSYMAAAYNL